MRRSLAYIKILAFAILFLMSACREEDAKVIQRGKLAEIYSEMLLTDQWVLSTPNMRLIADTSLVYEPILEKYGYDSDDYRMSLDFYMDDPERFARILRESGEILTERLNILEDQKAEIERIKRIKAMQERFRPDISYKELFPYLGDEPYVHYYDSIGFETDSSSLMYRLVHFETSDTLYDGVRMFLKDTLAEVEADTTSAPVVLEVGKKKNDQLKRNDEE